VHPIHDHVWYGLRCAIPKVRYSEGQLTLTLSLTLLTLPLTLTLTFEIADLGMVDFRDGSSVPEV